MSDQFCRGVCAFLVAAVIAMCAFPVWSDTQRERGPSARRQLERSGFRPVQKLLDVSGLAWMGGDTFLAVHDAKFPGESERVRVSLLQLPASLEGIMWKPLRPRFPGRLSSDLESASRIPGTRKVLLIESGDDDSGFDRIYLARSSRSRVRILDAIEWSSFTAVANVEGTAVAATESGYLFIWAERAQGSDTTLVQWRDLSLTPFAIGTQGIAGSASFSLPADLAELYNRPLVAMDVSESGELYTAAALDGGADDGPYRSAVLVIGQVVDGGVVLDAEPIVIGTLDGFKVESVALRSTGGARDLFIGTDDENFGGTLRPLPLDP